jgi:hypothetical protein
MDAPSRPPSKGCVWEKISAASAGLEAWVQRCDYGFRKIDFLFDKGALAIRFSDGGGPDPLVETFDLLPGETAVAAARRIFAAHTDKALAARCVLAPYRDTPPPGKRRYTFVPNVVFAKELARTARRDEVGDPPCGEWGEAPDGIQYFEVHARARKLLFVRVGQDVPLFDEKTLRLIVPVQHR